jgi:dTDP-4-dehydrorhamnose reductase
MSKPDECNLHRDACLLHNVTATQYMVHAANQVNASLIYVSTDFVFGDNGPHAEDALPAPLNFYGESKLLAEQYVKAHASNYAIMRPVFIYGPQLPGSRPSFLHWVKNNLQQGNAIRVVSDQQRTPTYVYDICKGLLAMMQLRVTGNFHLAGNDILSPYQMAMAVAQTLQLPTHLVQEVTSHTFAEPVQRAKKSGLLISKAKALLQYQPVPFTQGILLSLGS